MTQSSFVAQPGRVEQHWWLVDAANKVVGRLASDLAVILMGKHTPRYTAHAGDRRQRSKCSYAKARLLQEAGLLSPITTHRSPLTTHHSPRHGHEDRRRNRDWTTQDRRGARAHASGQWRHQHQSANAGR